MFFPMASNPSYNGYKMPWGLSALPDFAHPSSQKSGIETTLVRV